VAFVIVLIASVSSPIIILRQRAIADCPPSRRDFIGKHEGIAIESGFTPRRFEVCANGRRQRLRFIYRAGRASLKDFTVG
jgi:hypothetical protein